MRPFLQIKRILTFSLPLIFGVALLGIAIDIFYSEGRRLSIAAQLETTLIEKSLQGTAYRSPNPDKIIIVSASDADRNKLPAAESDSIYDLSFDIYVDLIERILNAKPKKIMFNWLAAAHGEPNNELQKIADRLLSRPDFQTIAIGYPVSRFIRLDKDLAAKLHIYQGYDCYYDINSYCSYIPQNNFWFINLLVDLIYPGELRNKILSENLPHYYPMFLLNLANPNSLPQVDVSQALKAEADFFADKYVYVGNAMTQSPFFAESKDMVQRTLYAGSRSHTSLSSDGVPFHVFWAMITQMLIEEKFVTVVTKEVVFLIAAIVSILVILAQIELGVEVAFFMFLFVVISYPIVNKFTVAFLNIYLPLVSILFSVLLIFIFSSTFQLAYQSFQKWRTEMTRESQRNTLDLVNNFISLISHNLNTPIARLVGSFDVFQAQSQGEVQAESLIRKAKYHVIRAYFLIRSVLYQHSVDQGSFLNKGVAFGDLLAVGLGSQSHHLLALDIDFDLQVSSAIPDFGRVNVNIDERFFAHALSSLVIVLWERFKMRIVATAAEEEDGLGVLQLQVLTVNSSVQDSAASLVITDAFFDKTLFGCAVSYLEKAGFKVVQSSNGVQLSISL